VKTRGGGELTIEEGIGQRGGEWTSGLVTFFKGVRVGAANDNGKQQASRRRVAGAGGDEWEYASVREGPCLDTRCWGGNAGTPARRL
jgi:hypothetical protein